MKLSIVYFIGVITFIYASSHSPGGVTTFIIFAYIMYAATLMTAHIAREDITSDEGKRFMVVRGVVTVVGTIIGLLFARWVL